MPARNNLSSLVAVTAEIPRAYVDTPGAALYTSIPRSTLETLRSERSGPRFIRVGRSIRYRVADLDAWMAAQPTGGAK